MADGAKPVTRENRLLTWATEVEAQLVAQRQELRRSRVELMAAQEVRAGAGGRGREEAKLLSPLPLLVLLAGAWRCC